MLIREILNFEKWKKNDAPKNYDIPYAVRDVVNAGNKIYKCYSWGAHDSFGQLIQNLGNILG